jgi:hypothetical protein
VTFDPSLSQPVDRVRQNVGDFSDAAPILPEATYLAALSIADDDEDLATVYGAEWLILKVGQDPDKVEVTGAVKVEWTKRIDGWRILANGLRVKLGLPVLGIVDNAMYVGQFVRTSGTSSEFGG